jgi:hypothetical protein
MDTEDFKKIMTAKSKYFARLQNIPAPGGNGCHTQLLSVANLGVLAGYSPEEIQEDIRQAIPSGKRRVSDSEIEAAVYKATSDHKTITLPTGEKYQRYRPHRQEPIVHNGKTALQRIIEQSNITDDADLWESSPVRPDWTPQEDAANFLFSMFMPDDLIFIGERLEPGIIGQNILTMAGWIKYFQAGGKTAPFLIINPLSGKPATKKNGDGETFRGDGNIKSFRYCLAEFDNLSREDQIRFWTAVKLPIVCLVDSGGKSIHGWIDVQRLADVQSVDDWQREIRQRFYEQGLIPLGVDSACSNPARLARLPGHLRTETGNYQNILWLAAPENRIENQ